MLNTDMDALLDNATSDLLVDKYTYSALGDVPDTASTSVIEAIRHTLMDCTVRHDIYVITDFVSSKIGGHRWQAILSERFLEQVASVPPDTSCLTTTHFICNQQYKKI